MMSNPMSTKGKKHGKRSDRKEFKVKYISSPMKFKASASEFRALVQELTGQDSDSERFIELNNVQNVQKSRSPIQQWKNGVDTDTTVREVPALSYPYNYSYGLSQRDSEVLFESMNQGFHFDMLSSDQMHSLY